MGLGLAGKSCGVKGFRGLEFMVYIESIGFRVLGFRVQDVAFGERLGSFSTSECCFKS